MARMPGATWQPKALSGRSARRKGRCVVFHVAVSEAQNLMPGPNADWHFYVARDGRIYQYIDTDLQSWATGAANPTAISVETQGGVNDPQGEPWSAAQVASCARIARWAHDTEGVPLRLMQSSLPGERGLGWHRLGVDPWRVSGGELWSSARGKVCPGDAKIAQMPDVLRLALNGAEAGDDMTPEQANALTEILANARSTNAAVGQLNVAIRDRTGGLVTKVAALTGHVAALAEAVSQLSGGGGLDGAAITAAAEKGAEKALADLGDALQGADDA